MKITKNINGTDYEFVIEFELNKMFISGKGLSQRVQFNLIKGKGLAFCTTGITFNGAKCGGFSVDTKTFNDIEANKAQANKVLVAENAITTYPSEYNEATATMKNVLISKRSFYVNGSLLHEYTYITPKGELVNKTEAHDA